MPQTSGYNLKIKSVIRSVHPFPARMAPEVVWHELRQDGPGLTVLDPMAGSGTTLVAARLRGYRAVGYDLDPLAVLIAQSWVTNTRPVKTRKIALRVLAKARDHARRIRVSEAYPRAADDETKTFVRYWFDRRNRIQLAALSRSISRVRDKSVRTVLWCALSRTIITKQAGVSLAIDVSHSRPHRAYDKAPILVFDAFERAVEHVLRVAPFRGTSRKAPSVVVRLADARKLPVPSSSVDIVITSPPYLNAIDYMRAHKFSLIWMGHSVKDLRNIRAANLGAERAQGAGLSPHAERVMKTICDFGKLSGRQAGMLHRFVLDKRHQAQARNVRRERVRRNA